MTVLARLFSIDPDRVAVCVAGEHLSYGRFQQDILAMAQWLHQNHVGVETRIGITPRPGSYWTWVAHLAALRVGAHHITTSGKKAFNRAIEYGLYVHLGAEPSRDLPKAVRRLIFKPGGMGPLAGQLGVDLTSVPPDAERQAARIALTSGTTGKPRALRWDQALIEQRIDQTSRGADISADTRLFAALSISTTGGFRYPLATWSNGGTVFLRGHAEENSGPAWRDIVTRTNLLVSSPPNLRMLLQRFAKIWPGREERAIFMLGGRVPSAQRAEALRRVAGKMVINYGSTETGTVAAGDVSILDRHPGAVGFARDGAIIEIVGADDRPLPAGETGMVRIRTQGMCTGYEQESESGDGKSGFRNGWFYPGDQGMLFEDGLFAIAGRISETVNLGGVKVSVPELEAKLGADPRINDVCIVPIGVSDMDMLAFVMELPPETDAKTLYPDIMPLLPAGISFRVVQVRSIPRNAMGKVERRELISSLEPMFERGSAA